MTIGQNVQIENSFIFAGAKIDDNVVITLSVIGANCHIKANSKILAGSIIGQGVIIECNSFIENGLVQSNRPSNCRKQDCLGAKAYRLQVTSSGDGGSDDNDDSDMEIDNVLVKKLSHLHLNDKFELGIESDDESDAFRESDDDDDLSNTVSPVPDDTKRKWNFYLLF